VSFYLIELVKLPLKMLQSTTLRRRYCPGVILLKSNIPSASLLYFENNFKLYRNNPFYSGTIEPKHSTGCSFKKAVDGYHEKPVGVFMGDTFDSSDRADGNYFF